MTSTGIIPGIAGDGGDPRISITQDKAEKLRDIAAEGHMGSLEKEGLRARIRPQERLLHDPNVSFEEYLFYAEKARAEEDRDPNPPQTTIKSILFPSSGGGARLLSTEGDASSDGSDNTPAMAADINLNNHDARAAVSDLEWTNASRALRSATAAACFYLITTDILGPFGIGFSIGTMGWGEGIGLFTLFGFCAGM